MNFHGPHLCVVMIGLTATFFLVALTARSDRRVGAADRFTLPPGAPASAGKLTHCNRRMPL